MSEHRSDIDTLSLEYADVERQKRAAILAGDVAPETPEPNADGGERREISSLIERAEIASYLQRGGKSGNPVSGVERELATGNFRR